jgi:sporulation protein YqfC
MLLPKGGYAMARKISFMERLTQAADLPDEPLPGLPLIEVAGDRRVLIEHHCGVMEYSTQEIRVKVKYGHICVEGSCLTLTHMTKGQLIISGRIHSIHLIRGCQ